MERVRYMEDRERSLNEQLQLSPEYAAENKDVSIFRLACVERIWRLSAMSGAFDGTAATSAVRLFDRCMGKMNAISVCKANMLILAIACFDICFKAIEGDFRSPGMFVYYHEGFCSKHLDFNLSFAKFPQRVREAEIEVLRTVDGEPAAPTALDYLHECCPEWAHATVQMGRRAEAAAAAYSYCLESANHTSEEIAASAAWIALGNGRLLENGTWPTPELALLCCAVPEPVRLEITRKMAACMQSLFGMGESCMMFYYFHDVYEDWSKNQQRRKFV
jgi:hypothetical protein